jgi:hypothetical protein
LIRAHDLIKNKLFPLSLPVLPPPRGISSPKAWTFLGFPLDCVAAAPLWLLLPPLGKSSLVNRCLHSQLPKQPSYLTPYFPPSTTTSTFAFASANTLLHRPQTCQNCCICIARVPCGEFDVVDNKGRVFTTSTLYVIAPATASEETLLLHLAQYRKGIYRML